MNYSPHNLPMGPAPPSNTNLINALGGSSQSTMGPTTHTTQPIVTGTSVLGILYKDGVMLAADTLGSYGSLARFRDLQRLHPTGNFTIVGASGDISDYQYIQHTLDGITTEDYYTDDGHQMAPEHIYEYLSKLMYHRRSESNPLWNKLVVGGFRHGKRFLGCIDLFGTPYKATTVATGFGAMIAQPLLRKHVEGREDTLTEAEAKRILEESMRVLFYRDARSLNKIQIATIDKNGARVTEPYALDTEWGFGADIRGYGASG